MSNIDDWIDGAGIQYHLERKIDELTKENQCLRDALDSLASDLITIISATANCFTPERADGLTSARELLDEFALKEENQKLKGALAFYANKNIYKARITTDNGSEWVLPPVIDSDAGQKAREALANEALTEMVQMNQEMGLYDTESEEGGE